jgi:hypothetical protein
VTAVAEPYFFEVKQHGAEVTREWRFKWAAQGVYCSYSETVPVLRCGAPWAQCLDCVGAVLTLDLEPLPGPFKLRPKDLRLELLPAKELSRLKELLAARKEKL